MKQHATHLRTISESGKTTTDAMQQSLHRPWWKRIARPKVMAEEQAKAQGVFIPNWWLGMLLIPLAGGVLWVVATLTAIQRDQTNIQNTIEFRMKQVETQAKLNDEHLRQIENRIARIEGKKNIQPLQEDQ